MGEKKRRPRGQVIPLGGGRFRVRVPLRERGPNGRARVYSEMLYDTTPEKAKDRRDDLLALIRTGQLFTPAPLTAKALSEEWMGQQKRRGLAVTTLANYQDTLNSYVLPYVGDLRIGDLQPKALERMFNRLQDRGLADSTIRHARVVCKLFVRYALAMRYLKENPLEGVELPKGAPARDTKSLTPDEARALVEVALLDLDDLIFVFALFTGLRPKEYLGLPLANLELVSDECAVVRVTRQAVKLRRGGHEFPAPKTKRGVRAVPFPAWLHLKLMQLKAANEARARVVGAGWKDYGLAFPSRKGKPISEGWLRRMFARLLKRVGLPPCYTPYSLRYTYNTLLYLAGVTGKPRSVLMGHARENFNFQTYVKALPEMFEGVAGAFEGVAGALETQIFGAARTTLAPGEGGRVM